jgi:cytochrome c oxidase assembly protein subunit 15
MDGAIIPSDLLIQNPAWINFFENPKTVQFIHRAGAYVLFALAFINMVVALRSAPQTTHARRAVVLFALVTLQAAIGVATLLLQVPLHWGLLHQAGALIVLGFAVANWRGFYGEFAHDTMIAERD